MKRPSIAILTFVFLLQTASNNLFAATPQSTAFTYQGQLLRDGVAVNDNCDFHFSLFEDSVGASQVGARQTVFGVPVVDGLFTVELNGLDEFGATAFNGDQRYLEIGVRCPPDLGFTLLSPLQILTPTPHALALPGLYTEQNATSPNLIGGFNGNNVSLGAIGATIGGGGSSTAPNRVTDDFGTVGGGLDNQAGDGAGTTEDQRYATVSGGIGNTAENGESTVGGGLLNTASGLSSTVGGGAANTASGIGSTVGGGGSNTASGIGSTVGGGDRNTAAGDFSFAAGRRAKANHDGAFVWGDSDDTDFISTGPDQFLIRATGGVGIGTTAPAADLHIRGVDTLGSILVTPNVGQSNSQLFLAEQQSTSFGMIMRYNGAANQLHFVAQQSGVETAPLVSIDRSTAGNVGIGTTSPGFKLEVNGSAGKPGGGSWSFSSDRRLKKNIRDLDSSLDQLMNLRGVTFEYKDPAAIHELRGTRIGMIAQEVEEIFPDWVSEGERGYKTLTFRGFEALTVEAIRELREEHARQLAERDAEIVELEARLARIEALLNVQSSQVIGGAR